jgi:glycosidase
MKLTKFLPAAALLAAFAFPAFANENIPADYFGDSPVAIKPGSGYDNPYALVSRSSAEQDDVDPTAKYTPSPEDWRDRNIYQLFTDRFATDGHCNLTELDYNKHFFYKERCTMGWKYSRNFHQGGNWRGLKDKIWYLKDMGVTAVWISGVQMNSQAARFDGSYEWRWTPYHQYHVDNFFVCEPASGTFQELKDLIDELHANHIAVILDVAPNHMSDKCGRQGNNGADDKYYSDQRGGDWWGSARGNAQKHPYPFDNLDRFHLNGTIQNWDTSPENLKGQFKGTDDLMQEDAETSALLEKAFKNLIDATDCDGFRVDAIKHIPYDWCRNWAQKMRDHAAWRGKKNFLVFGELFSYSHDALADWCKDAYGFNASLDFPLMQAMNNAFGMGYSGYQLGEEMGYISSKYGKAADNVIAFLDNHDVNRFACSFGGNNKENAVRIMKPAMTFLYLAPPIPLLYYGTEHCFNQGGHGNGNNNEKNGDENSDYYNPDDSDWQRECMFDPDATWGAAGFQPGNAEGDMFDLQKLGDKTLYWHIQWLNGLRNKSRALRRGGFAQRAYAGGQGLYAFTKWYGDEVALVLLNTADYEVRVSDYNGGWLEVGIKNADFKEGGEGESIGWSSDSGWLNLSGVTLEGKGSKVYIGNFVDNSADVGGSGGGGGGSSLWANGTHAWPTEATAADTIYINTQVGNEANVQNVKVIYGVNNPEGDWPFVEMEKNTDWDPTQEGGAWYHYELPASSVSAGELQFAICVSDGEKEFWDNNGGTDYHVTIAEAPETDEIKFQSVVSSPVEPVAGGTLKITAAIASEPDTVVTGLVCSVGYAIDPKEGDVWPVFPMAYASTYTNVAKVSDTETTTNIWTYFTHEIKDLPNGGTLNYYLAANNDDEAHPIYANNGGNNYVVTIKGVPAGLTVTTPATAEAVADSAKYTLAGTAGSDVTSDIAWTNALTAKGGTFPAALAWTLPLDLGTGENTVTLSADTLVATVTTNAADTSADAAYDGGDYNGKNGGTGFNAWTTSIPEPSYDEHGQAHANGGCWTDGRGFGLWCNQWYNTAAKRFLKRALKAGDTFSVTFKNGNIAFPIEYWDDNEGVMKTNHPGCGFGLCNESDQDAGFRIWFNGGDPSYQTTAGDSGIGWTTNGIRISVTMTSDTAYTATLTPIDGASVTLSGTFSSACNGFRFWSWSNKEDIQENNYDVLVNDISLTESSTAPGTATATVKLTYNGGEKADPEIPLDMDAAPAVFASDGVSFALPAGYGITKVLYATNLLGSGDWDWEETEATVTTNQDHTVKITYPDVPNAIFGVWFEEK